MEFEWPSDQVKFNFTKDGRYIPNNNALAGVKLWRDEVYVTVPRWRPGVPITLGKVVLTSATNSPVVQAYPSFEYQTLGNPSAFQFIQSMEIDTRGWMWILDVGRLNLLDAPSLQTKGVPKLIIWNIDMNCSVREFIFPDNILPYASSWANDIVVDVTAGLAYISDTWAQGGIVVYDFQRNEARRFDHSSLHPDPYMHVDINGRIFNFPLPSDGIALSNDFKTIYFCEISRQILWSVPSHVLANFSMSSIEIGQYVRNLGVKGFSDGMTHDDQGRLVFGNQAQSAVYLWNTSLALDTAVSVSMNNETMQWPDTFAWDGNGSLVFVSNKLQLFAFGGMMFDGSDGANFRIWKVNVGANSYMTKKQVIPLSAPCLLEV
jgi:hypothetical protein